MHITHVITRGDVGGAQTHLVDLASAQHRSGERIRVIAGTGGPAIERLNANGVQTEVVTSLGLARDQPFRRRALVDLRAALDRVDTDIVHAHSSHAGLLARLITHADDRTSVYTAHGWPFQSGAPAGQRVVSWIGEAIGAHLGDGVICLTEREADLARRARVVASDRLFVVPNGLADVAEPTSPRAATGALTIVMVARFASPKQQLGLMAALATVTDLEWQLLLVGDGPELDACRTAGLALLGDRVHFAGHRDDVDTLLRMSDVGVLWSRYEGMPISLIEMLRAGLPVVGSDLPGIRAVLGNPPVGSIARDEQELAAEIRALLVDPDRRQELGRQARQRFVSDFSIDAVRRATAEVYLALR